MEDKKNKIQKNIFYICYVLNKSKMYMKVNSIKEVVRRINQIISNSNDVILIGKTYLVQGQEVRVIKKIKSDLKKNDHHKQNNYKCFLGETPSGTRMYIHPSDVACPLRTIQRS